MFFSIPQINREFDPHPLRREEFLQLQKDGKLIYGQLPLLEIDGLKLVQSQVAQHFFGSCKDVLRKVFFFFKWVLCSSSCKWMSKNSYRMYLLIQLINGG